MATTTRSEGKRDLSSAARVASIVQLVGAGAITAFAIADLRPGLIAAAVIAAAAGIVESVMAAQAHGDAEVAHRAIVELKQLAAGTADDEAIGAVFDDPRLRRSVEELEGRLAEGALPPSPSLEEYRTRWGS